MIYLVCISAYLLLAGLMSLASMDIFNGTAIMVTLVVALPVYWFKAGGWSGMETVSGLDAVLPALLTSVPCLIAVSLATKERKVPVGKLAAAGTA